MVFNIKELPIFIIDIYILASLCSQRNLQVQKKKHSLPHLMFHPPTRQQEDESNSLFKCSVVNYSSRGNDGLQANILTN